MRTGRNLTGKMDLNHLHLHVRNLDRAQRFYETYFGFRRHAVHAGILFLRNTSGFDLALVPGRTSPSFPEWFHFGFRLRSARAVHSLHTQMSSDGLQVDDVEEYPGYTTFRCVDPEGYQIEIYWA